MCTFQMERPNTPVITVISMVRCYNFRLLDLNNRIQKLEVELAKPCTMCTNYENQLNKQHLELQV